MAINDVPAISTPRAGYGVSLVAKGAVLPELTNGALVPLYPRLQVREDSFSVFQKLTRAERPGNTLVTECSMRVGVREFGDALGASPRATAPVGEALTRRSRVLAAATSREAAAN